MFTEFVSGEIARNEKVLCFLCYVIYFPPFRAFGTLNGCYIGG